MAKSTKKPALPRIVIGTEDHEKLWALAANAAGPLADVGEQLLLELDRARVVDQKKLSSEVVRMGSTVSFITSDGFDRTFQLVFPGEADVARGKISVMTPIGAALIGLSGGQTIPWKTRDHRDLALTIRTVSQDAPAMAAND